jgi:hypothetical protein
MGKVKKTQQNVLKNSLESLQSYGSDAVKTVAKTTTDEVDTFFSDLLGIGTSSESEQKGNHGEVEIFNSREKKAEVHVRAHIEYHDDIRRLGEKKNHSENQQAIQKIQEALAEIQQLIKSSKALEVEFADFAVMETPKEVGDYDLNFFEWLILTIKQAREKVDDSGAWLTAVKGKNGKKGQDYWSMFKKNGTSFAMSSERSSATSVG